MESFLGNKILISVLELPFFLIQKNGFSLLEGKLSTFVISQSLQVKKN